MCFEAKHREFKETAHSTTSRKNITFTLTMKQQLNFSYKLLTVADTNLYTSNLQSDPIISLSKVNFSGDDVIFVSWVFIKGIMYNCKNMSVVLNLCDENVLCYHLLI